LIRALGTGAVAARAHDSQPALGRVSPRGYGCCVCCRWKTTATPSRCTFEMYASQQLWLLQRRRVAAGDACVAGCSFGVCRHRGESGSALHRLSRSSSPVNSQPELSPPGRACAGAGGCCHCAPLHARQGLSLQLGRPRVACSPRSLRAAIRVCRNLARWSGKSLRGSSGTRCRARCTRGRPRPQALTRGSRLCRALPCSGCSPFLSFRIQARSLESVSLRQRRWGMLMLVASGSADFLWRRCRR
jgi:hypothetical protein